MPVVMISRPLIFRAVARSGRAFLHYTARHGLQVVRPADLGEHIDEGGSEVGAIVAQLGGFVVPWEDVMVIVPALAEGADADAEAVGGADGAVEVRKREIPKCLFSLLLFSLENFEKQNTKYISFVFAELKENTQWFK